MNVNGIGTAGYPLTGYTARKTGRSAESGAVGFMETVEEKAAQGKTADQDEKAFEMVGPNAPAGSEGCVDGCGERSKCEWHGNPGQRDDEPHIADDGAAA